MSEPNPSTPINQQTADGLRYARWAGHLLGILLIGLAIKNLLVGAMGTFTAVQTSYFIIYGLLLNAPFTKVPDAYWKRVYAVLIALSFLFVFLMIATVMFAYMAAADRGEKLGVPGFEGTLIFLALLQVPVILFQRKPDLLD
ncbi:MAG TPA: hypothetical protein DCX06_02995 [Opitutae bacterium]|nr:hypothetical protein [Opitutae bacterium]